MGRRPTAKKMVLSLVLEPALVGQFEFLEWAGDGHLRHMRFIGLREDKEPKAVVRNSTLSEP